MSYTLNERDGWLFVVEKTTGYSDPIYITNWWPTGQRFYDFARWFASPDLARAALGRELTPLSNLSFRDERGWQYRMRDGGSTKPEYGETTPIPEPKQRGRKLPVEWRRGEWYRQTARGWKRF